VNFFTELKEGLGISWGAIRANKMRSILTTLGIVIGIVTVTLMGTAIEGLNRAFLKSISFIGADVLYVGRFDWFNDSRESWMRMRKRPKFTLPQIEALQRQLTLADAVAPVAQDDDPVKYKRRHSDFVTINGTTEQFLLTSGVSIDQGRFLSAAEIQGSRPVCVIGQQVASNLFLSEPPVGTKITIDNNPFEVVGVLEKQGGMMDNGGIDNQIIIPLQQFLVELWSQPDFEIQVKVKDLALLDDAKEEIRGAMRRIRHLSPNDPDDFSINQQDTILDMFHKVAGTIAAIGLFITGLSLFVGGIGIMNIMFVSVAERTREIGIRKAIGAKRRTILVQFLSEAATICLLGGFLGIAIAWPLTLVLQKFMPAVMSPLIVSIAVLVSLITGVLSGFFPAWRAARMNPVDALRQGE
jgi:putative ABC transport system permease protein